VSGNPRVSKLHVQNTSLCHFNSAINSSMVTRVIKVTKLFAPLCAADHGHAPHGEETI
jgi:hypothetical protein